MVNILAFHIRFLLSMLMSVRTVPYLNYLLTCVRVTVETRYLNVFTDSGVSGFLSDAYNCTSAPLGKHGEYTTNLEVEDPRLR